MRTIRILALRTLGRLLASPSTLFASAFCLALAGGLFVFGLRDAEGTAACLPVVWALAAGRTLPLLAAFATMRLWADERATGRLDLLLTAPVGERNLVLGKFFGAWIFTALALVLFWLLPALGLPFFAPGLHGHPGLLGFLPALASLFLQAALWCAIGQLASACTRHAAVAAFASLLLTLALPFGAFQAALAWSPALRQRFAALPLEQQVTDFASGLVSISGIAFYAVLTAFALFAASKAVAYVRFVGRGARVLRLSTAAVVGLAFVFSCLTLACVYRLDVVFELPGALRAEGFSPRTRQILAETQGAAQITCFLPRESADFRRMDRLLHGFEGVARASAGLRLSVSFVDPRWDLGEAAALVRSGVPEGSLVFSRGRRRETLRVAEADETTCASALLNLASAVSRKTVCFTVGHGEASPESYDAVYGLSAFARALKQEGYLVKTLDLAAGPVPGDCAVVATVGARTPFSHEENQRLDGYLRNGGRLLALLGADEAGAAALVARWGARAKSMGPAAVTRTGTDLVARDYSAHRIAAPLAGTSVTFAGGSAELVPTADAVAAAADSPDLADKSVFRPLVSAPGVDGRPARAIAAAVERGGGAALDLGVRPTRLVAVGDPSFALNGALASRANANRDFLLNAVAWLAGRDAYTAAGTPAQTVVTGMDRRAWKRFTAAAVGGAPLVAALLALLTVFRRRGA